MDDKDLEKQLTGLFAGLKDFADTPETITIDGEPAGESGYQLEKLFSDDTAGSPDAAQLSTPAAIARVEKPPRLPQIQKLPQKPLPAAPPAPVPRKTETVIVDATPQADEERLLQLLTSKSPENRQLAVEQLAQIQKLWVIDPLLRAITDSHPAVAGLALAALLQMDDQVKHRLLALARQTLPPLLQRGSEVYFSHLLSQPFVYVPSGPFLMGSPGIDSLADENEQPQHALQLGGFWIARYPVTTTQFKAFINKTGHRPCGEGHRNQPDDHPAIDMTWGEALAYCRWLNERSGLPITLPSEAEWEKAARGTDGRRYPWGDDQPTAELCNFHKSTPVGSYSPQGDSPFGCADMAGNVWEWTRSIYQSYPYNPRDDRENLEGDQLRVIRGLTFNNAERFTRCAFRYKLAPDLHLRHLGFRVAISPGAD